MLLAQTDSTWNSLEIVKLVVGVLSPAVLLLFGLWLNRHLRRFELLQWSSQKVIERRLAVFQELAPLLNDLLCYFTYIGSWKNLAPPDVVKLKRQLDRIAYVNAPLFPSQFIQNYNSFVLECYSTYTGWGEDAKLKTLTERRKQAAGSSWDRAWDACFAPDKEVSEPKRIRELYSQFMSYFAQELGVGVQSEGVPAGHPPTNVR